MPRAATPTISVPATSTTVGGCGTPIGPGTPIGVVARVPEGVSPRNITQAVGHFRAEAWTNDRCQGTLG